jgi:Domain of unknown function (DUF2017)
MAQVLRRRGRIQLRLNQEERDALAHIVTSLRPLVAATSAATPRAYDDEESQADYSKWVHSDLELGRNSDVDVVAEGLSAGEDTLVLTEEQAFVWLRALTHLRLAAGTQLGISSDGWETGLPPQTQERIEFRMLTALGWIQEELIAALES